MELLNKTVVRENRERDTFLFDHKISPLNTTYYFSCTKTSNGYPLKTFNLRSSSLLAVMKILSI